MQLTVKKHDGKKAKIVARRISLEPSILSRPERGGSKISTRIMPACDKVTFGAMQQSATSEEEEEEGSTEPAINKEKILHKGREVRKATKEKVQKGKGSTRTKSKGYGEKNASTAVNHNQEVPHRVEKISDGSPPIVRTEEIDLSRESETAAVERIHEEEEEGAEKVDTMSSLVSQGGHEVPERHDDVFHETNTTKNQFTESGTLARRSTSRKVATETSDDVQCEDSTGMKLPSGKGPKNKLHIHCTPPLLHLKERNSNFCNVGCVCKIYWDGKATVIGQSASSSGKIECTELYIKKQLLSDNDGKELLVNLFNDNFASADESNFELLWKLTDAYNPTDWIPYAGDSRESIEGHVFLIKQYGIIPDDIDWLTYTDLIRFPPSEKKQTKKNRDK
jgi:hypothetical protein